MNEQKSLSLELKDFDMGARTAVIAHAVYNNIDRTRDITRKGAFTKSWNESKQDIAFYMNHDDSLAPGKVTDVYEDEEKAYTVVKLGTHTLGEDCLKMMDEGIAKSASFGYITVKSAPIEIKGQKIRELLELKHLETSILTKMPANASAGLISVQKSVDLISRLAKLEKFIYNSSASDECIKSFIEEFEQIKSILSGYDTASTPDGEPVASEDGVEALVIMQISMGLAR